MSYLSTNKKFLSLSYKIIFIITFILTIALSLTFYVMSKGYEDLIYSQVQSMARLLFQQVLITRKWIADHGGIFIEQTPHEKLQSVLDAPSSTDITGKADNVENPSYVTRQLSRYARQEGIFWYRLTSLTLINPANEPDEFEKNALIKFESDSNVKEVYTFQVLDEMKLFRYVAPIYVGQECMKCHKQHGYKIGDIRGALSITIPVDNIFRLIKYNRRNTILSVLAILTITIICLFLTMRAIVISPISKLTTIIRDYGKRKLLRQSTIGTGGEIEELSRSFLRMAYELNHYHHTLDMKVREATQGLHDLNNKLIESNKKLEESNQYKSDLIASISHELRTPLTSIKGAIDYIHSRILMINDKDTYDDIADFLEIIKKNADRLINLINSTIDLERIELGKIEMHVSEVDLAYLINDVIRSMKPLFRKKHLMINISAEKDMLVSVDEDRIQQVLINLISNAITYSEENDTIEIRSCQKNGVFRTEIVDNGPGIKFEERKNIFQRYYKKGNHQGTGLGLAICKAIIEAHNGKIGVQKNEPKGSTFYFTLNSYKRENEKKDISC